MVFGPKAGGLLQGYLTGFQFPVGIRWCSDLIKGAAIATTIFTFNSLWELDGVRTRKFSTKENSTTDTFNSLWELDGVRTR